MSRIERAEVSAQLLIGSRRQIHLPHSLVIAKKWIDRRYFLDAGLQRSASDRQRPALRCAGSPNSRGIDLRHLHHYAGELRRVQKKSDERVAAPASRPARV